MPAPTLLRTDQRRVRAPQGVHAGGGTWFLRQLWYMDASLWWMVAARYWQSGWRADTESTSQYFRDFIIASLTSFSICLFSIRGREKKKRQACHLT